ncbi:hypothetical protein HMPREF3038_03227, partial [Akkermansia sp. KLE1797]
MRAAESLRTNAVTFPPLLSSTHHTSSGESQRKETMLNRRPNAL